MMYSTHYTLLTVQCVSAVHNVYRQFAHGLSDNTTDIDNFLSVLLIFHERKHVEDSTEGSEVISYRRYKSSKRRKVSESEGMFYSV